MGFLFFGKNIEKDKSEAVESLIAQSAPRPEFFLMVVFSVVMATLGLLIDSVAVVIGSMLIAPVLYPILAFSMGIVMLDFKMTFTTLYTILKSLLFAVVAAVGITYVFSYFDPAITAELLARTQPTLAHFGVAVVAGLAASFALVKPHLNETLPGVAVSVALVPPIAAIGIGLARLDWFVASNATILLVANILGIMVSSFLVFSVLNLYAKRHVAKRAIKKEEEEE